MDKKSSTQDVNKNITDDAAVKISGRDNLPETQNGYIGGDAAGSSSGHRFHENSGEKKKGK